MKKTVIVLLAAVAVSCGNSDSSSNVSEDAGGSTGASATLDGPCTEEYALGCDGDILVECSNRTWNAFKDCKGIGKKCGKNTADDEWACVSDGSDSGSGSVDDPSTVSCDVNGHFANLDVAFVDRNLIPTIYRVESLEISAAGEVLAGLSLLVNVDVAPNTPISLAGNNSRPGTCQNQVCMTGSDAQNNFYMANEGTITFSELGEVGGQHTVSLSGVKMRQVNIDATTGTITNDVQNGKTWCIPSFDIAATVYLFPCFFAELEAGQSTCGSETQIVECTYTEGAIFDELHLGEQCAMGTTCQVSNGNATCQ